MSNQKINYQKLQEKITANLSNNNRKPTLLLHSCCAPCSTKCLETLFPFFNITVFYYNPNITDENEYEKRKAEQISFISKVYGEKIKFLDCDYSSSEFYSAVSGLEKEPERGKRCYVCYNLRLEKTAVYAKKCGFDFFTTTLSVSPYKNSDWLNEIGFILSERYDVEYLPADFKKNGGYHRSVELSEIYGLYRQNYCGCEFSKNKQ